MTDDRFTERAFAEYRQQHGIHDSQRIGDMPLNVMSEILRRAQQMKIEERAQ